MKKNTKNKRYLAVFIACLMGLIIPPAPAAHANIFIKPKTEQQTSQEDTSRLPFLKRLFRRDTPQTEATQKKKTKQKSSQASMVRTDNTPKPKPFTKEAFQIYTDARKIDHALLVPTGREAKNAEELMQIAAFHNTANVVTMLQNRRLSRMAEVKYREAEQKQFNRINMLNQAAELRAKQYADENGLPTEVYQTNDTGSMATPEPSSQRPSTPTVTRPQSGTINKPSRVFKDY